MKTGFKDPASVKKQHPKDEPRNEKKEFPWSYKQPQYDERSSCFINAGTHYGVGKAQPVGHHGDPKHVANVLPFGKVKTMAVDEAG